MRAVIRLNMSYKFLYFPFFLFLHIAPIMIFIFLAHQSKSMFDLPYLQAIREGLTKAQQDVSSAGSDEAKAEAEISLECYESLSKALE